MRRGISIAATAAATVAVGGVLGVGAASAAGPSTFCSTAGLPSQSNTVGVSHVAYVTVNTCGAEQTPRTPPCSFAFDDPGLVHLKVYACGPLTVPVSAGPAGPPSVDQIARPGNQPVPPDCGPTVDRVIGNWEIFACVPKPGT